MSPPSNSSERSPLTKDRIVGAAVAFADEHGIDGLSMRKLASELGAGAMSLYNHVANKDELLTAMVDVVTAEIEFPHLDDADPATWRRVMRASAMSAYDVYAAHNWAVRAAMSSPPGPLRLRYMEAVLAAFADSGLEPEIAHHAYHSYEVHIIGFTLSQQAFRLNDEQLRKAAARFLSSVDTSELPHVASHVEEHLHERDSDFEFGLDLLLDGFARLRSKARSAS